MQKLFKRNTYTPFGIPQASEYFGFQSGNEFMGLFPDYDWHTIVRKQLPFTVSEEEYKALSKIPIDYLEFRSIKNVPPKFINLVDTLK